MKELIKNTIQNVKGYSYHNILNREAAMALRQIESQKGKTNPKFIQLSTEYAQDTFGDKKYAPWIMVYSAMAADFKEGWIPDNYYGEVVVPKLKGTYGAISNLNGLQSIIFDDVIFPDLIYYINGIFITTDQSVISEEEVVKMLRSKSDKYALKSDYSIRGGGVQILDSQAINIDTIKKSGNSVVQTFIHQNSFFEQIMPNSVATIRVTSSISEGGKVEINACFLRVARDKESHVKFNTNIMIPLKKDTGQFFDQGITPNWHLIERHPDTNFVFKDKIIPNFEKVIEVVTSLHKKVPFARIIGWDVIIDEDGLVKVMEWNGWHDDIKYSEATSGPIFKGLGLEKLWKK